jgi:hypothetical protein
VKKAIETLERIKIDLDTHCITWRTLELLDRAIAELKAPPRGYTPEEWKAETDEAWPDDWAVYTICVKDHREFWYPKSLELVKKAGVPLKNVICATEAGKPPDDWRPKP